MNFFTRLLLVLFISSVNLIYSQNWRGTVNSDWNNPANWSSWPLNNSGILIDPANYNGAAAHPVISANSVFNPAQLVLQNGAQLQSNANLTVSGRIEILGPSTSLTLNSGTLQSTGSGSQGRIIVGDDGTLLVNGGLLRSSQRIIAEFGGEISINSGTVNPLAEFALIDGSLTKGSKVFVNGGVVNIGSMLEFENEDGHHEPAFIMSGGALNVGTDMFWLGIAPGSGTPRFIMSGGTATVNGNILNDLSSTVNLYFSLSGNANFNFNGTLIDMPFAGDSVLLAGSSVFKINSPLSLNNNGVYKASGGDCIINGNTSLVGTGTYTFHNISIQTGKSLVQTTPPIINVNGNITNNGSFSHNNKTVILSGNSTQTIGGINSFNFSALQADNTSSGGIILNTPLSIGSQLILNAGIIHSSASNIITMEDNAVSSPGSNSSYVNGPIKKKGNDAFVFPTGKNGKWRRIEMSAPQNNSAEFTAEYFSGSYANPNNISAPLSAVSNLEYWSLNKNNVTDSIVPTLYWESASQSGITNCSQLSIAKWTSPLWSGIPSTASGNCTGNGTGSITAGNYLINSSILTYGFYGNVYPQNLTLCNGQSLQVGSGTYTVSGNYVNIFTSINQLDSVVLTNLTILDQISHTQNVSICAGSVFNVGTGSYSVSGIYSDTLLAVSGCDSIVNTQLTVKAPLNVQVNQSGLTLTALNATATSYQWLNCISNQTITGETNSFFNASQNGSYAVIINDNACIDTSACYQITSVGIENRYKANAIVYPNPSNGMFNLKFSENKKRNFKLCDLSGRIIQEASLYGQVVELNYSYLTKGIYILEISEGIRKEKLKLLIE